ncbi:hypothetical protein [Mycoplasma sp. P36-A1]|uniref:hypothetical protein n=1 Tax=Mycoplasma sp. P36-A1 TaxID=3252900 RepID=UPI003C2D501F
MEKIQVKVTLALISMILTCIILVLIHMNPGQQENIIVTGSRVYVSISIVILVYAIGLILFKKNESIATRYLSIIILILSVGLIYLLFISYSPMSISLITDVIIIFSIIININWFYFSIKENRVDIDT